MSEHGSNRDATSARHRARRVLLGGRPRTWIVATLIGVVITLCFVAIAATIRWSISGPLSVLLFVSLVTIGVWYSYAGGGLVDSCLFPLLPTFLASVTLLSITITFQPYPVWQWPGDPQILRHVKVAVVNTLLWGTGVGVIGFMLGKLLYVARIGLARSWTRHSGYRE